MKAEIFYKNTKGFIQLFLLVLPAFIFNYLPVVSLLRDGPFSWHVTQPAAWQGGLEVFLVGFLIFLALQIPKNKLKLFFICLVGLIYARRHAVDLPIILIYLTCEGILSFGTLILRRLTIEDIERPWTKILAGFVGFLFWSLIIWTISLLGKGSIKEIQIAAICILGASLFLIGKPRLLNCTKSFILSAETNTEKAYLSFLIAFFLALFAKASYVIDYDSLWYGLRAKYVLVSDGNIFASTGLVSVAHYVPKLFEALQLPFAGFGSISLIFAISTLTWLVVIITAAQILKEFGVAKENRICAMALIASVPAGGYIAVTAKGDTFATWLMLVGILFFIRFIQSKDNYACWISLSCAILVPMIRLSSLPLSIVLLLAIFFGAIFKSTKKMGAGIKLNFGLMILGCALLVFCMVNWRTLKLTGVPIIGPAALVDVAEMIGFQKDQIVGVFPSLNNNPRFPILKGSWNMLFNPGKLPHIMFSWVGNAWLYVILCCLFCSGYKSFRLSKTWPLLLIGITFPIMLFTSRPPNIGGDGNYWLTPIICFLCLGFIGIEHVQERIAHFLKPIIFIFACVGGAVAFVTGSWGPGTRGFDTNFLKSPFDYKPRGEIQLHAASLIGVNEYFSKLPEKTRVVGLDKKLFGFHPGWWLPVRYEPLQPFAHQNPDLVKDEKSFEEFLKKTDIEYIVIPDQTNNDSVSKMVINSIQNLFLNNQIKPVFQDSDYSIWRILSY